MEQESQHRPFTARLRDWDSERLFTADRQVRELIEHPGYRVVLDLIGAANESAQTRMKHGPIMEQAEYARAHGLMAGLESVKSAAESVLIEAERVADELQAANGDAVGAGR